MHTHQLEFTHHFQVQETLPMGLLGGNDRLELLGKATKLERGNVPKNLGLDKGKDNRSTPGVDLVKALKYCDLRAGLRRRQMQIG